MLKIGKLIVETSDKTLSFTCNWKPRLAYSNILPANQFIDYIYMDCYHTPRSFNSALSLRARTPSTSVPSVAYCSQACFQRS